MWGCGCTEPDMFIKLISFFAGFSFSHFAPKCLLRSPDFTVIQMKWKSLRFLWDVCVAVPGGPDDPAWCVCVCVSRSCPRSAPLVTGNRWNGSQEEEIRFQISLHSVWNFSLLLKFALCLTCLSSCLCTGIYSDTPENGSFFSSVAVNWIFYGFLSKKRHLRSSPDTLGSTFFTIFWYL